MKNALLFKTVFSEGFVVQVKEGFVILWTQFFPLRNVSFKPLDPGFFWGIKSIFEQHILRQIISRHFMKRYFILCPEERWKSCYIFSGGYVQSTSECHMECQMHRKCTNTKFQPNISWKLVKSTIQWTTQPTTPLYIHQYIARKSENKYSLKCMGLNTFIEILEIDGTTYIYWNSGNRCIFLHFLYNIDIRTCQEFLILIIFVDWILIYEF